MKKKNATRTLALCLALAQPLSSIPVFAVEPVTNPNKDSMKVLLENEYWYKVKMPALIDLTYDQDSVSYKDDYDLQACGEIHGKMLQVETDDIEITSGADSLTLENYIGRADKGEMNHKYILGANEGERELDSEWQPIKGLARHDSHGVKPGNYSGTANYKFKLVDSEQLIVKGVNDGEMLLGANGSKELNVMLDGEDVTEQMSWESENEDVAFIKDNMIMTSGKAEVGDTTVISGELDKNVTEANLSAMATSLQKAFGPVEVKAAGFGKKVQFTVTIVEVNFEDGSEEPVESISLFPGDSTMVKAIVVPKNADVDVTWTSTLNAGVGLERKGNKCTLYLDKDVAEGTSFFLVATVEDYSKFLPVNVKSHHTHTAGSVVRENEVAATCEKAGSYDEVTYCVDDHSEMSRKTVTVPVKGHDWGAWQDENGVQVRYCSHDRSHKETGSLTSYSVTYNLDGGSMSGQKTSFTREDSFTLPTPTKDGYEFVGWTGSNGSTTQKSVTVSKGTTGKLSYTANWKKNNPIDGTLKSTGTYNGLTYKLYDTTGDGTEDTCLLTSTQTENFSQSNSNAPYKNANIVNVVIDDATLFSTRYMFYKCGNLKSIKFTNTVDTSNVVNMSDMFSDCYHLTNLDINGFDTSNVQDMRGMFQQCQELTGLDVSNFNTSNVTNMSDMFYGCYNLTNLDASNFNTSKVTNMGQMFRSCHSLTSLDVSNFDTSNVTNMQSMFLECKSLTNLDVSNFNTSKVTNMCQMFYLCEKLTSLNVSNFDTSNVTNMSHMFDNCKNLTSLNASNFNTSKVTDMSYMFSHCRNLTSLNVSNFNTSKVTNMNGMFSYCPAPKPSWYKG